MMLGDDNLLVPSGMELLNSLLEKVSVTKLCQDILGEWRVRSASLGIPPENPELSYMIDPEIGTVDSIASSKSAIRSRSLAERSRKLWSQAGRVAERRC